MKTTESILDNLAREREEHLAAGHLVGVQRVDQEVIAHQTLARLRADRARYAEAGDTTTVAAVDVQIRYWRSMVDVDADVVLVDEGRPELVDPPATPARAKTPRSRA